jgi:cyclopropane-fatty-acyl-phospholipid synthase
MKREASLEQLQDGFIPSRVRARLTSLLSSCGIDIDGPNAWDVQVYHEDFYPRVLTDGSLGLGESFMEGWWDVRDLDGFIYRLFDGNADEKVKTWRNALAWITAPG